MPPPQDPFAHVEVRVVLPRTILIPRAVQISTTLPLDSEKARLLDPVLVNGRHQFNQGGGACVQRLMVYFSVCVVGICHIMVFRSIAQLKQLLLFVQTFPFSVTVTFYHPYPHPHVFPSADLL